MNDGWMEVCLDGWMGGWIQTQMCRPEHDFEHMYTEFRREFNDLSIMDALKSRCKALEHIRMAFWPLCCSNTTCCYIILKEQGGSQGGFLRYE